MTEFTLDELHAEIGRLYDEENVTLYHAQNANEALYLLILQTRGMVRVYKSNEVAGLQRARELRQKGE